jgi:DNA-directed RNA polymerase specialized sigma24 family protein
MRKKSVKTKNATKSEGVKGKRKKIKFEDCLEEINVEIAKKRGKWNLTSLAWIDYEDVSQIIRFHIFKKWHLYNPEKKLKPWIRTIISNQLKNLIRNNYTNFTRPCARCAAATASGGCEIYKTQSSDCPLFKNWEKNKKGGMHAKMPLPLENHAQEVYVLSSAPLIDIERASKVLHKKMESILKTHEWKIYKYLYIDFKEETEVAKLMGYKTSEKNRNPGYKQIKNVKKKIINKVKELLDNDEIDIL